MRRLILVLSLLFLPLVMFAAGSTTKFVFTTEPQTIAPNELSGPITIQSQDASGEKTNTTETIDLEFSSSSLTGEFLNSSGNPASPVMNKNTANRTFYYRESSAGTYVLKVRAVGRESGQVWEASQQIVVSVSGAAESDSQEGQTAASSEPVQQSVSTVVTPEFRAKIIGGDKTAIVGAQINFEGAFFGLEGKPIETADFLWTFGDGTTARGRLANHAYNYPGKYIVYLNVSTGGISAGDSMVVSAVANEIKISEVKPGVGGWVEVFNGSDAKIDLSHWAISSGKEAFYFPKNTFIDAKTYLIIPKDVSGIEFLSSGAVFLLYPRGDVADELAYSGALKADESFHDVNGASKIGVESPASGRFVARMNLAGAKNGQSPAPTGAVRTLTLENETPPESQLAVVAPFTESDGVNFWNSIWAWFGLALTLGILSAAGFLFVKRKSSF